MKKKGSFLFIFYFLLNEEVRKYLKDRKKKKRLKLKEKYFNATDGNADTTVNKNDERLEEAFEEEDEDDDDDDDEDDDDDYDFEAGNETEQNANSTDANTQQTINNQEDAYDRNALAQPNRFDNFNRDLSYQSENPDVFSLSCPPSFNKKGSFKKYNNNSSSSTAPKNVKFENANPKLTTSTTNQAKPSTTSSSDLPTTYRMNLYENEMSMDLGTTSATSPTTPTLLWPQQKRKMSFRNPSNKQNLSINSSGADVFDASEEKVTVL